MELEIVACFECEMLLGEGCVLGVRQLLRGWQRTANDTGGFKAI
jgi:hypothetical protein